jgi:hypothetical protein
MLPALILKDEPALDDKGEKEKKRKKEFSNSMLSITRGLRGSSSCAQVSAIDGTLTAHHANPLDLVSIARK